MDWGRIRFFLGEVGRNFTRNAGMQATAVGTVALTVLLLGAFLYARAVAARLGSDVFSQIQISVYLKSSATPAQEASVRAWLARDPRVASIAFVSKAQGLAELRRKMKGEVDTSLLTQNPLPDMFRVHARNAQEVPRIAKSVAQLPAVQKALYGQEVVGRLLQLASIGRKAGIGIIVLFLLVAGIIISNTIRLTVYARRREISIMQLVGATNMYIRMPFICEGLLAGVVGALVAIAALALLRASLLPKLALALPWLQMNTLSVDLTTLILQLVAVGAGVGILGSWFAVGRYLRT